MKLHHLLLAALTLPLSAVTIDWTTVGDAGNPADPATGNLYGAVGYDYRISKYETTIGQYTEFLNAKAASDPYGLYNPSMASNANIAGISRTGSPGSYVYSTIVGSENRPITYVSWFDAARFTNWLHNGQGGGSTETGAYTLNGEISGIFTKNPGAEVWIPSEDEWYKAAYYGAGSGDNYWLHAIQSDTLVDNSTSANYYDEDFAVTQSSSYSSGQNYLTDVGAYAGQDSYYGTFDQGGNVWEWNDAVLGSSRGLRGGSLGSSEDALRASNRNDRGPSFEDNIVGFRVASGASAAAVPEPGMSLACAVACGLVLRRRRR